MLFILAYVEIFNVTEVITPEQEVHLNKQPAC